MVNQDIVKAKISHIEKNLQRLAEKQNITFEEFKRNVDAQDIILHNLQLAVQGCIDIASHVISNEGWTVPDTLLGLFDILMKHKIISAELSDRLKKMAGFRNIIVHEYGTIDLHKVHKIIRQDIGDIRLFLKRICAYAKI